MKRKNLLGIAGLFLAVMIGLCACGKNRETVEEKAQKYSREDVYEMISRVERKTAVSPDETDHGLQEKWSEIEQKKTAADRALAKDDYDTAMELLQEAETAADKIQDQLQILAPAKSEKRKMEEAKSNCNMVNGAGYASTLYKKALQLEEQGNSAYQEKDLEAASKAYQEAAAVYENARKTAAEFSAALEPVNSALKIAEQNDVSRYAPVSYQAA